MIPLNGGDLHIPWQKELARAFTTPEQLLDYLGLDHGPWLEGFAARRLFPMRVPKPFADKMHPGDPADPLLRQVLPLAGEFTEVPGFVTDPLDEHDSALPGLLHKYRSRVLLVLRGGCAVNCRYCFRRHFPYADNSPGQGGWQPAVDYIAAHAEINEVILSGGDPLMAKDEHIAALLSELECIPHLKRLRIHSRLPVVIPTRLTGTLRERLSQSRLRPVLVVHVNHANEIDQDLAGRLQQWQRAGITLLNQSVLLAGVNDDADALEALSERLFEAGVLPYYVHQLDKVAGAAHFAVSDDHARALMARLLERLPGFLVPRLVREIGGEVSKTPLDLNLEPVKDTPCMIR
ncbi:EF-P beta-lysylation protein EpmB [Oceanimonas sp. CHS3-5]|uniref:EF-P beta-lysylation protein EpmB n=1 Tax=Oceanimonas sp. CHS3-5 TaxID=3068186 RepID=UPI00273E4375|nr:EF-P beta-lysylation protein EpmB [Oceanimonas sp. CHS3-5]MDP5293767.1 EF-P beta-lysylation protein EpmB [Oceanimonas sp. CHS3-5]